MIFETHAHYDDEAFENDRDRLIKLLGDEGISPIINIGASVASTERSVELAGKYDHIYAAVGVHPSECADLTDDDIERLRELSANKKVIAIGEIGLDYHYEEPERDIQKKWFEKQLDLALDVNLPIIVHSRDAAEDTFSILAREKYRKLRGVIHCFSYSVEMAREYVKMGFYIGVGGVVTFKNGRKLHETVKEIPIEKLLIETDAPYLSPEPYRGRRNSSAYLPYVIETIASLKSMSYEEVEKQTYENAVSLFGVRADG